MWKQDYDFLILRGKRLYILLDREDLVYGVRLVRSRFVKRALILGYHSIRDQEHDPFRLGVSTENFEQHIEVLREYAHVLSVSNLLSFVRRGRLPARSVAITFDDGYVDNLETVLPLLQRRSFPATVFMTTGYFGKEFWWDSLVRLVYSVGDVDSISLRLSSTKFEWCRDVVPFTQVELVKQLGDFLIPLSSHERFSRLEELREIFSVKPDDPPNTVALTESQTKTLASSPLIEIGCHTVSHPMLSRVSISEQRAEIAESKEVLERLTGQPIDGFAFPHRSICETSTQIVRDVGFKYACSGEADIVWRRTNPFSLPRVWVPNCTGEVFLKRLNRWL